MRIIATGDDWDTWGAVDSHFAVANAFASAALIGAAGLDGSSWPDLDMLPFGVLSSPNSGRLPYRNTSLTHNEQYSQMTLWATRTKIRGRSSLPPDCCS